MVISTANIGFITLAMSVLVRYLVGRFPHSGEGIPPMYGDYEAQRHWMEITTNLPPDEWYRNSTLNDLSYWGLDYPPLTAYHMLVNGAIANVINSSWIEMTTSRGIESYQHKIFMRSTVLISDLMIYTTSIVYYFKYTEPIKQPYDAVSTQTNRFVFTIFTLMYPAQILIDHGHFQYNCVFMGLVIWAVILLTKERQLSAALLFTLALNYKQMSLYYALPFFWYLFGANLRSASLVRGLINIVLLAVTVSATFIICWTPYLTDLETASQVLTRLFPFNRGLYEDKVANIWFCLSVLIKFKKIYTPEFLVKLSTAVTLLGCLPTGLHLLWRPSMRSFKYALVNSSLVFFLASFHVHEKTILVPAVPILLLFREHPQAVNWFVIISTFSLQPLLIKDKLMVPYFVLIVVYLLQSFEVFHKSDISTRRTKAAQISLVEKLIKVAYLSSILVSLMLSGLALYVDPPKRYPDFHATINAIYCCGHFVGYLAFFTYNQVKSIPVVALTSSIRGTAATTRRRKKKNE